MNEIWMTSDERGDCTTLLLPTRDGRLRVRISGPGTVVREWARRRRAWDAQGQLALLARMAEKGNVVGKLIAEDGAIHPVDRMSLQEARQVAGRLRRCLGHVSANGLPAAGTRVAVSLP